MRYPAATLWRAVLVMMLGIVTALPLRADTVAVLLSDQRGTYGEFADALAGALRRALPAARLRQVQTVEETSAPDVRIVVAVGSAAQQAVAARPVRPPVLAVLTPRLAVDRVFEKAARVSALYLDHPEERQLTLLSLLPAGVGSVGFVSSPASAMSLPRLRLAAQRLKVKLVEVPVTAEREVARAVQEASVQSEVLLAHPDPGVFNPQTIQNILLTTYRARVPVFGFSPAYTRAGALLSLHSTPLQLAEQAADMTRQFWQTGQLPAPQYPRDFEISVNRQVARSLGIDLPAETVLVERLKQRELR